MFFRTPSPFAALGPIPQKSKKAVIDEGNYKLQPLIAINDMITIISYSLYKFKIEYINGNKNKKIIDLKYHVLGELKYRKCFYNEINQNFAIIPMLSKVTDILMLS